MATVKEKEKEHFMKCGICGQYFDMRDLTQVIYHEQIPHRPVPVVPFGGAKRIK